MHMYVCRENKSISSRKTCVPEGAWAKGAGIFLATGVATKLRDKWPGATGSLHSSIFDPFWIFCLNACARVPTDQKHQLTKNSRVSGCLCGGNERFFPVLTTTRILLFRDILYDSRIL